MTQRRICVSCLAATAQPNSCKCADCAGARTPANATPADDPPTFDLSPFPDMTGEVVFNLKEMP